MILPEGLRRRVLADLDWMDAVDDLTEDRLAGWIVEVTDPATGRVDRWGIFEDHEAAESWFLRHRDQVATVNGKPLLTGEVAPLLAVS